LAGQTSFAEEVAGTQDGDDRFFAVSRNDGELNLALLDIKQSIGGIALDKNRLILAAGGQGSALADLGQEALGIEGRPLRFQKDCLPCAQYKTLELEPVLLAPGLFDLLQGVRFDVQISGRTAELIKRVSENDRSG